MTRIITVHSSRGGTGKSSTAASMAALMAAQGHRVALVDTDIQSPSVDTIFGIDRLRSECSLVDYLAGRCEIEDAVYPVGEGLSVVTARSSVGAINEITAAGYDVGLLNEGFARLGGALGLDVLLLDTHTGINTETVMSVASSDAMVILTRADRLGLTSAPETVALADQLGCSHRAVVVNMVQGGALGPELHSSAEAVYGCEVTAVLPYAPEMSRLSAEQLFVTAHPRHPLVDGYRRIISFILAGSR
ncbi:P-loop NTPase [Planomonospora algeriensis]